MFPYSKFILFFEEEQFGTCGFFPNTLKTCILLLAINAFFTLPKNTFFRRVFIRNINFIGNSRLVS